MYRNNYYITKKNTILVIFFNFDVAQEPSVNYVWLKRVSGLTKNHTKSRREEECSKITRVLFFYIN